MHFLHVFTGGVDGGNPIGPLVQDAAGTLYGVAQSGWRPHSCPEFLLTQGAGCGVVFKIAKTGTFQRCCTLLPAGARTARFPKAACCSIANGNLFGTAAEGGIAENGTVYQIASDGTYTVVHRFTQAEGQNPNGGLVEDRNGNIFGTAQLGGNQSLGTVFQLNPDGSVKVLHSFQGLAVWGGPTCRARSATMRGICTERL